MNMNIISKIAYTVLLIGGLNWGLIGFFDLNLVGAIFSIEVARVIYGAVGIAAIISLYPVLTMKKQKQKKS